MTVKISLMAAYMIETLLRKSNDPSKVKTFIQNGDLDSITQIDDTFDYQYLIDVNNDEDGIIVNAIDSSYQVKFMTVNGLKNLLKLKFNLTEQSDYTRNNNRFLDLSLTNEQLDSLGKLLSSNWIITNKQEKESNMYEVDIKNISEVKDS